MTLIVDQSKVKCWRAGSGVIVRIVRSDSIVGRGSCSVIDETYTDQELLTLIRNKYNSLMITDMLNKLDEYCQEWAAEHMPSWLEHRNQHLVKNMEI